MTIIAIVLAAACVLAGWHVLRSDPSPVELSSTRLATVEARPSDVGAGQPSASTSQGASPSPVLVVDVTGRVRQPGIVELPAGSRVVDALRAAGGARPAVDTSPLNLARLLVDGEQIVVGLGATGSSDQLAPDPAASGSQIASVNLNTATAEELETLPGVGPVTAASIIEWRAQHGAFSSVDELLEVSGIGDATLEDLEPYVHV